MGEGRFGQLKKSILKWEKSQWVVVILTGILLMVVALPTGNGQKDTKGEKQGTQRVEEQTQRSQKESDYEKKISRELEEVLEKIAGAGKVRVMVTFEDSGEEIVEKDCIKEQVQETQNGAAENGTLGRQEEKQEETTVYREEGDVKEPFIQKEKMPAVAGVLVVAQGGDDAGVKQDISDAVMALFQIEVNRIKVVKMNIQEAE